jgi:DNA-binding CsgD family transcriptional regulator
MRSLQEITQISIKYQKKIKKLTDILNNQFGLSYFAIQNVSSEGLWSIVGNHPGWLEYSAGNEFYKYDPSLINPAHYQSSVIYAAGHPHPEFQNIMQQAAVNKFNIDHCLAVINKNEHNCEFVFFATSSQNKQIINTYMNELHLLRQYIAYFKIEAKPFLEELNNYKIDLKQINSPAYFNTDNIMKTPQKENTFKFDKFSKREQDCLGLFLEGKTAKETAKVLNISPRTVEEYLANIKRKLGCKNKYELLKVFLITP